MQETVETPPPKNVGKKNEESSKVQAQKIADRYIKKKMKTGYAEVNISTNKPLKAAASGEFDFNRPHENSTHFKVFKPQNTLNAYMTKQIQEYEALLSRKRDGYMHYLIVNDEGAPMLYSANMEISYEKERKDCIPLLDRFPMIEADICRLALPPRTMLVGEICASAHASRDELGHAVDSRPYVSSILKSYTPEAIRKQKEGGDLAFCVWDAIWIAGEPWVQTRPVGVRYDMIRKKLDLAETRWITVPELVALKADGFLVRSRDGKDLHLEYDDDDVVNDIVNFAKERKWEGFVCVDPMAVYGDKSWEFHGKNPRPKFICKLKPDIDVDVIVYWDPDKKLGTAGKGKHTGGVGAVQAFLLHPEYGEIDVGKVGLGISDEQAKEFADPELYPMVWQVTCKDWTEKGKMGSASLVRVRDDKKPEDCGIEQRPGDDDEA
jgi:hypothetical protein